MKQSLRIAGLRSFFTLLCLAIVQAAVLAQDAQGGGGATTTTVTKTETTTWYTNPWVWVIGAAVFILLLVALLRGGSKGSASASDRLTVTKTVTRE